MEIGEREGVMEGRGCIFPGRQGGSESKEEKTKEDSVPFLEARKKRREGGEKEESMNQFESGRRAK